MSDYHPQQPQSPLESHPVDEESLTLWLTNDSSSRLTHLIETEALSPFVSAPEIQTSTKTNCWLVVGLTLCLMWYGFGLILFSQNLPALTPLKIKRQINQTLIIICF